MTYVIFPSLFRQFGAVMIVWQLDLQLPVHSVSIITTNVSLNHVNVEVYLIQHYVIKCVSDLRQVGGFLRVLLFPLPIKLTPHDITEIFLKAVLKKITLTLMKQFITLLVTGIKVLLCTMVAVVIISILTHFSFLCIQPVTQSTQ